MKPQRSRPSRRTKGVVLIQCEGSDTEYNYFLGLRGGCGREAPFRLVPKRGEGGDAVEVVRRAVREIKNAAERGEAYDEKWCVLDVEREEQAAKLTEAIALAGKHGIHVCLSNPSFEVWLLAHFERVRRDFHDSAAVERRLSDAFWGKHFGCDYDKGDARLYERLVPLRDTAVDSARWTMETFHGDRPCREANASTEVYRLIGRLLTPG